MRGSKYLLTLLAVYMAYMSHGVQAIILSQNLDQFVMQWGTDKAGVYTAIAYTGLGKFVSVWACGEISDRMGRRPMIVTGAILYVVMFAMLLWTHNYTLACFAAFIGGAATSFFDGGCYPAVQESWVSSPGTAVILIKGFISISGLLYPLLVVSLRQSGNWEYGVIVPLVMSAIVLVLAMIAPYSYDEEMKARKVSGEVKAKGLDADAQRAQARFKSKPGLWVPVGCTLLGFITMAAMYSAQQLLTRYGLTVVGMSDMAAAGLTSLYTAGSLAAVVIWGVFMSKFRLRTLVVLLIDLYGSVVFYALVCTIKSQFMVQFSALAIGFFAAGGALQCGVALMQEFKPGNKGRNLGIYYTFMGLASYTIPVIQSWFTARSSEGASIQICLMLNLILALAGALFVTVLCLNYRKWFGVSPLSRRAVDE